ncbi:unnamed protein product [Lactuca saligna]|uniref:Uncharacterized protein n=1 Tax=Lactuca saligna TaxID=75948 RepID=A0AA35YMS1_LACSI|nr:unnamed protein product [Lactuca saligna]
MFYQIGYKDTLSAVSKFLKPYFSPRWNGLFIVLFKIFPERVTRSDCASKLFSAIMYVVYTRMNIDYDVVHLAQRDITNLHITIIQDALMSKFLTFHTTGINSADSSKFVFVASVPEAMLFDVPPASKLLESYRGGGQKGGKKGEKKQVDQEGLSAPAKPPTKRKAKAAPSEATSKKRKVKQAARKRKSPTPTPRETDHFQSNSFLNVRNEDEQPIYNKGEDQVHNEEATSTPEVTPTYNDSFHLLLIHLNRRQHQLLLHSTLHLFLLNNKATFPYLFLFLLIACSTHNIWRT